jgi:LPXTG-site transpeptidase (sortase) family protein
MDNKLTEEDIRKLFDFEDLLESDSSIALNSPHNSTDNFYKTVKTRTIGNFFSWILNIVKTLLLFIVIFCVSFGILNFPALYLQGKYYFQVQKGHANWAATIPIKPVLANNNHLIISKIAVDAPVIWNVSEDQTLTALEKGVAHYQGTALPGQIGNVFISGHSSYYWWNEGSYKEVFALLDKLEVGDKITINYDNIQYNYEVVSKKVVGPNDLSVLEQGTGHNLSLMTCVPVGTNLNRLVVLAKQL